MGGGGPVMAGGEKIDAFKWLQIISGNKEKEFDEDGNLIDARASEEAVGAPGSPGFAERGMLTDLKKDVRDMKKEMGEVKELLRGPERVPQYHLLASDDAVKCAGAAVTVPNCCAAKSSPALVSVKASVSSKARLPPVHAVASVRAAPRAQRRWTPRPWSWSVSTWAAPGGCQARSRSRPWRPSSRWCRSSPPRPWCGVPRARRPARRARVWGR